MLRDLPKPLISDTTALLVWPGFTQRCIEEGVSLASADCLIVILKETQRSVSAVHDAFFITPVQTRNAFGVRLGLDVTGCRAFNGRDWARKFDSVCAPCYSRD